MSRLKDQRGRIKIIIPVVLVVLGIGAYIAWQYFSVRESTDDAQVDGHIHAVNVKVGGTVSEVNVIENEFVEAGAVLVQIDDRDFKIALARAQADLADAQAHEKELQAELPVASASAGSQITESQAAMTRAQGGMESAQKDIDVARSRVALAQARVVEAQANYDKAAKDLERMKPLAAKDEISQQQYDAVVAAATSAKAAWESSKAAVVEAESGVAAAQARVMQARAEFGSAEAQTQNANAAPQQVAASRARVSSAAAQIQQKMAALEQARTNLEYTTIKAPVAGFVSRKSVETGQVVQAGQPVLAVVPLNDVWITANFKETQLESMRPGQKAEVKVDAFGGTTFNATVESISAATGAKFSLLPAENASGNFVKVVQRVPVRLAVAQSEAAEKILRPGMSVAVTVFVK